MNIFAKLYNTVFKSSLGRTSVIYMVANILEQAVPFLLLPVLTKYLSREDYGYLSVFVIYVAILKPMVGLNTETAIHRRFYERKKYDYPAYLSSNFFLSLIIIGILAVGFFFFKNPISHAIELPSNWLMALLVVSGAYFIFDVIKFVWQAQTKALQYGGAQVFSTIMNVSLTLFFIVYLGYDWTGRIYSLIITSLLLFIISIVILAKAGYLKFSFRKDYIKNALTYSLPLVPHTLSAMMISATDKVFIIKMLGAETAGLYEVGYKVGLIIYFLAVSFNRAWTPWLYTRLENPDNAMRKKIVKLCYGFFFALILIASVLSLIAKPFLNFYVDPEFIESSKFVAWIAFGYAFRGMYFVVTNFLTFAEKTKRLSTITFFALALNIVLNYTFIKMYGAVGAAQATVITFLFQFVVTWYYSNKIIKMPWFSAK